MSNTQLPFSLLMFYMVYSEERRVMKLFMMIYRHLNNVSPVIGEHFEKALKPLFDSWDKEILDEKKRIQMMEWQLMKMNYKIKKLKKELNL